MTQKIDTMSVCPSVLPDRLISIPDKDQIPENCNVSDVLAQNPKSLKERD